jgi:hypothetical protein
MFGQGNNTCRRAALDSFLQHTQTRQPARPHRYDPGREVKDGLATLSSISTPTQRQLLVAITPLTIDVSDTTPANEAASTASQI